jgi:hypothetical protein
MAQARRNTQRHTPRNIWRNMRNTRRNTWRNRRVIGLGLTSVVVSGIAIASVGGSVTGAGAQTLQGAIGDRVWSDTNGNGIQDAGEPGFGGVRLVVTNASGATVGSAVSAADGSYRVSNVPTEILTVSVDRATLPVGARLSPPSQTGWALDSDFDPNTLQTRTYANAGGNLTVDLGLVGVTPPLTTTTTRPATTTIAPTTIAPTTIAPTTIAPTTVTTTIAPITTTTPPTNASLSGIVWTDTNGNGRREGGEPGRSTTVGIHQVIGGNWSWRATLTSNGSGQYSILGPVSGSAHRTSVLTMPILT